MVNQTSTAKTAYNARATGYRFSRSGPSALNSVALQSCARRCPSAPRAFQCRKSFSLKSWCTGEDSNLRSSKERQIYSLLPLTARPPVPNLHSLHPATKICSGTPQLPLPIETQLRAYCPARNSPACRSMHLSGITAEDRSSALTTPDAGPNLAAVSAPECHFYEWSWRRDLNPRPSDYKSDALPAELRQPSFQIQKSTGFARSTPETYPRKPMESASTLPLRAYHGTDQG